MILEKQETPDFGLSILKHTVSGVVKRIIFSSSDGKFSVINVVDRNRNENVLVGSIGAIQEGEEIEAHGVWENHKDYGRRFRVYEYKPILPTTEEGIRRYLSGGVIPGIGPKLAERIVDKFGADTLSILDKYSVRLCEIPGFGKHRLQQVRAAWHAQTKLRDQYIFLQGLGISTAYGNRIIKKYGEESAKIVADNPYCLATEVKGIGFKMADAIARRLNIAKDHPFRLGSGVVYVLQQLAERNGHTCYPEDELVPKAAEILEVEPEIAREGIKRALADGAIILDTVQHFSRRPFVYSTNLFHVELKLAELVKAKLRSSHTKIKHIKGEETAQWSTFNPAQQQAIMTAFTNSISIITGGPGVGKTTVTREIVAIAKRKNLKIALAAPTGRAAKRLSASSQCDAKTIHRFLKWEPEQQKFVHDENLLIKVDMVIIDEVSMLDVVLGYHLFCALAPETNLILIGDRDQLPSIGPGTFLADLIKSGVVPVTHLSQVYRQSLHSRIITNAHKINNGIMPEGPKESGSELSDFYWIEQEDQEKVVDLICRMVSIRIPQRFNLSPVEDIQVLTPMNHGLCGAQNLNDRLQDVLNPFSNSTSSYFEHRDTQYRVRDRVMQISNNYDLGVFNGDLGVIHHIDAEDQCVQVLFDTGMVSYNFDDVDQVRLAYAITIHKSQGSEFPAVVVPIITQHTIMLKRNLIYTAMTRASQLLIMVGSRKALGIAVNNYRVTPRFTQLAERIIA